MTIRTALVVDDSKSARFAMRKYLETAGYQVATADSAREAYSALQKGVPDVMFLDHIMPDIDGFQALGTLKQDTRTESLPIVLCSSNEGSDFVRMAEGHGALAVLLKPPSAKQIADVLHRVEQILAARPASARSKVQPIREREAAADLSAARNPHSTPAAANGNGSMHKQPLRTLANGVSLTPQRVALPPAPRPEAVRAEMESRLQKITQDLYAQLAEVRAQLALIDSDVCREDQVRAMIAETLNEQFALMTRQFDARLTSLRIELDDRISAQDVRIERLAAELRTSLMADAQSVAERAAAHAVTRLSDQIAESILNAVRPQPMRTAG